MRIVIDAGHGGVDPGAVNGDKRECDYTLAITKRLKDRLVMAGHSVILTRDADVYRSPGERARHIRDVAPDAAISIHLNSAPDSSAHGAEVIYRTDQGMVLAASIQFALCDGGAFRNRGIKHDVRGLKRKLAVLGNEDVVTVLVEVGFISNPADLGIISDVEGMAERIEKGLIAWAQKVGMS